MAAAAEGADGAVLCRRPRAERGAAGGGMAVESVAVWFVVRRALLNRRAREVLRATLDGSSRPRPIPRSMTFPSVTLLLGESTLGFIPGAGKLSRSGSYEVMLAWKSSKLTEGRKSWEPALSLLFVPSRVVEKLNLGFCDGTGCPSTDSLAEVGRKEGRKGTA